MKSAKPLPWTYLHSYPKSWQVDMAHPFLNSVTCQSVLWRWTHVTYLHTMHVLKHGCKLDINQISLLFGFLATVFNTCSSSCCFKLLRLNTASLGTFSAETRTLLNPYIHMPNARVRGDLTPFAGDRRQFSLLGETGGNCCLLMSDS